MEEKSILIAGFGGQGVLLAGEVLANAFMLDGKNVTWYPSYGAEMRGGVVNCQIMVNDKPVTSVNKQALDYLIALNQLSFDKFLRRVKKGGFVIVNSTLVKEIRPREDVEYVFAPITKIADDLKNVKVANILSLGIFAGSTNLTTPKISLKGLDNMLPESKKKLLKINEEAIKIGHEYTFTQNFA